MEAGIYILLSWTIVLKILPNIWLIRSTWTSQLDLQDSQFNLICCTVRRTYAG